MSIDSRHIVEQRSRAERTANAEVIPVPDPAPDAAYAGTESEESDASGLPLVPLQPFLVRRSGIYRLEQPVARTDGAPAHPRADSAHPDPSDRPAGRSRPQATQASGNGNGTEMKQQPDEAGSPLLPLPPITPRFGFEELRVDVDGIKPTMTVSGTITRLFAAGSPGSRGSRRTPRPVPGPDRSAIATAVRRCDRRPRSRCSSPEVRSAR